MNLSYNCVHLEKNLLNKHKKSSILELAKETKNRIASFGLNQSLSCLPVKEESTICKALDVVGVS